MSLLQRTWPPLRSGLSPRQLAVTDALEQTFRRANRPLYLVGGIVRDLLLARPVPADLDFATAALPEETERLATEAGADSIFLVGERFGTVGAVFGAGFDHGVRVGTEAEATVGAELDATDTDPKRIVVEITTFRREHYPDDTRFPHVAFGASLEDDLARRDFTANAIAVEPAASTPIDPYGGEADIALGVLRAVGDPDARFAEDPLRLLRAARFVAQLGFRLDPETERAMVRGAPNLERISQERIWGEMTKLLTGEYADAGLDALERTGLLAVAMPALAPLAGDAGGGRGAHREKDLWDHTRRVVRQSPPRAVVRWAALLHDAAKPQTRGVDPSGEVHFFGHERAGSALAGRVLRRLKADKATIDRVERLVELHGRPASYELDWTDSAVRRLALEAGDVWDDLLDLAAADVTSARTDRQRLAAERVAALRGHFERLQEAADLALLQSPLDGNDLMALFDRGPGIWIKRIKHQLRERVIDGDLAPDDRVEAERLARQWVEEEKED